MKRDNSKNSSERACDDSAFLEATQADLQEGRQVQMYSGKRETRSDV